MAKRLVATSGPITGISKMKILLILFFTIINLGCCTINGLVSDKEVTFSLVVTQQYEPKRSDLKNKIDISKKPVEHSEIYFYCPSSLPPTDTTTI